MSRKAQALCVKAIAMLQKERQRRKLSKYFIAQHSGLSPQMIAYVENGERNPTLETVLRIAEAMNVDFEEIMKRARRELSKPAK
ncbi:MAG: helix-turn-helix domain-containing protein [Verrucomicrobia bacterium]|nr:helix-turn-helix domain-containing protein [Verrucomicrobiota bacterium]MDE3099470.1 helix-turn-helix transcriptional regulator [Verrucomicrobiota bacterium]